MSSGSRWCSRAKDISGIKGGFVIFTLRTFIVLFILGLLLHVTSFAKDVDPPYYSALSAASFRADELNPAALMYEGEFAYRNFAIGANINLLSANTKIKDFDPLVLTRLEYDTGTEGIRYEPIDDMTFGAGLLIRRFSTLDRQLVLPANDGFGLHAYYLGDYFDLDSFATWSHIYGARVSEDFFGVATIGQSFVADADGEDVKTKDGIERDVDARTGYAFDLWAPLFGDFDFYSEIAALKDAGSGYSAGFHWGYNVVAMQVSARAEGRFSGKGFAPGYFGWGYEMNPIDLSSLEAYGKPRSGYLLGLSSSVLDYFNIDIAYEGYHDSNGAFSIDGWTRIMENLFVSAYFKQPSFANYRCTTYVDGELMGATFRYDISPTMYVAIAAKKSFDAKYGDVRESSLVEIGNVF